MFQAVCLLPVKNVDSYGPRLIPQSNRFRIRMRVRGQVHEDIAARIVTKVTKETSQAVTRNEGAEAWGRAEVSQVVGGLSLRKWSLSRDLKRVKEEVQGGAGKHKRCRKSLACRLRGGTREHGAELRCGQITAQCWRRDPSRDGQGSEKGEGVVGGKAGTGEIWSGALPLHADGCHWDQNVSGGRREAGWPETGSGEGRKGQLGDTPGVPCGWDG